MRQKLQSVMKRLNDLQALMGRFRDGTDEESTMLLARVHIERSIEGTAHVSRTGPAHKENGEQQTLQSLLKEDEDENESLLK